jgi:hypothetical protein
VAARKAQGSGYDDPLARERSLRDPGLLSLELQPGLHQASDEVAVVFEGEVLDHSPRHDLAYAVDPGQLLHGDPAQEIRSAEAFGYELRRDGADVPDTKGV